MKHIYTHDNVVILHSVKNLLALNDIESLVKNEHTIPLGAQLGINNAFFELWIVNDQDFEKASAIIDKEIDHPAFKSSWMCSNCGEKNEGSFETCWKCSTPREPMNE